MLTKTKLEKLLNSNISVRDRLNTLKLAERLNPDFRSPHIVGGYLRNTFFGVEPKDCDVVFEGTQLNQPGVLEAVKEAELKLGIEPYLHWEFENASATGVVGDYYADVLGNFSHHTDFITLLAMDSSGTLHLGDRKTLFDLEHRIYDLRFSGIEIWVSHRGKGRSYESCLTGDLIRGMYLAKVLTVEHSAVATFLTRHFDVFFNELSKDDQEARRAFWLKKTGGDPSYQQILKKFGVKSI